jgi:hypothetical protein
MPVNGFSVGRDVSLDLVSASGPPVSFGLLTGFQAKADTVQMKVKGLDGQTYPISLPDAHSGSFDFERTGPSLDDYFCAREESYFQGVTDENLYITETITEPNGGISQYRYDRVVLEYADAGSWAAEATVKQKVNWVAARKRKVA